MLLLLRLTFFWEREYAVGWVGKWERIWEGFGEGKNDQNIQCVDTKQGKKTNKGQVTAQCCAGTRACGQIRNSVCENQAWRYASIHPVLGGRRHEDLWFCSQLD